MAKYVAINVYFFQANVATRRDILIDFFLAYVAKIVATSSSRPDDRRRHRHRDRALAPTVLVDVLVGVRTTVVVGRHI